MAAKKPSKITITSYQVGFGDCYLLTFHYPKEDRHVLIDFGTKKQSKVKFKADMKAIANCIKADCGGKLAMVVATHRHYDHISGFATSKKGDGPGDIIRSCKPDLVVQPWTEDPDISKNATGPAVAARAHVNSLSAMNVFADALTANLDALVDTTLDKTRDAVQELTFLGSDNITNRSAVENLMAMAPKPRRKYLHLGSKLSVGAVLPGVKIRVLGPPTLEQNPDIKKYANSSDEYWKLQALAATPRAVKGGLGRLFRDGQGRAPLSARWFAKRLKMMRADSLLEIVRTLDDVMNNTSLILLFEVGGKRLLFPGDAQLENWSAALRDPAVRKLLEDVDLFKVGHHGSLNATPRHALWEGFKKRDKPSFQTLLSTRNGEYSNVPKASLLDALTHHSTLLSTEDFKKGELSRPVTVEL